MPEIIITLLICWLIYVGLYSPRARIRRLWKQIYRIPIKMERAKKDFPDRADHFSERCQKALRIRYNMINALLDYHFDPEEDKEYIKENKDKMPFDLRTLMTK